MLFLIRGHFLRSPNQVIIIGIQLALEPNHSCRSRFLSGVLILAYLWLSVEMTDGSCTAVGTGRLVDAIAIPLVGGILSASFGEQVIQALSQTLESVNLPCCPQKLANLGGTALSRTNMLNCSPGTNSWTRHAMIE